MAMAKYWTSYTYSMFSEGLQSSRKKDPNTGNNNASLKGRHLKCSFDIINV